MKLKDVDEPSDWVELWVGGTSVFNISLYEYIIVGLLSGGEKISK